MPDHVGYLHKTIAWKWNRHRMDKKRYWAQPIPAQHYGFVPDHVGYLHKPPAPADRGLLLGNLSSRNVPELFRNHCNLSFWSTGSVPLWKHDFTKHYKPTSQTNRTSSSADLRSLHGIPRYLERLLNLQAFGPQLGGCTTNHLLLPDRDIPQQVLPLRVLMVHSESVGILRR